jgi:enoyl-CoA hydratase/carnithine racemase
MTFENIIVDRKDKGIVKVTLNRPHVLNALNSALWQDLKTALEDISEDETVSVVILTGAGRAFSTGRDLKDTEEFFQPHDIISDAFSLIDNLEIPLIAAVNGFAITGGFEMALACDLIIASEDAVFRDTHVQVGIIPGGGNTQRLPRLIGEKKAKELLFTSEFISAVEAERIGIVNKVVPAEKLEEESMALARKIASQPKDTLIAVKRVMDEGMGMDFKSAKIFEHEESVKQQKQLIRDGFDERLRGVIEGGRGEMKKE